MESGASSRAYYSIGLGAESVTPLEMARAYATLAHGGRRVDGAIFGNKPRVIEEITEHGRTSTTTSRSGSRPLTGTQAGIVNSILQKAVSSGTGKRASSRPPVAGKTGTTENYGDAWFVGYTPQLVTAVWVGYPNKLRPMLTEFHGEPVTGGTFPALIWKAFMEKALHTGTRRRRASRSPTIPVRVADSSSSATAQLELDNGHCRHDAARLLRRDGPDARRRTASENEVEVPDVRGDDAAQANGPGRGAAADAASSSTSRPSRGSGPASSSTRARGAGPLRPTTGSCSSSRRRRTGSSRPRRPDARRARGQARSG